MDDLGFNKIAGAVLATGLGMLLLMKLPGVFIAHADESIAYKVGEIDIGGPNPPAVDLPFPQQDWVDAMDAAKGAKVFKKCKSCHNAEIGGANGTGPALYGVVGNDIATQPDYKYSAALTGLPANWDYEALDAYLEKPAKYAPGTKMNFVGLKKPADRAAVIEYLRVADPTPEAQPIAAAAEVMEKTDTMNKTDTMEKVDVMEKTEMVKDDVIDTAKDVMESVKDKVVDPAKDVIDSVKDKN